MNACIALEAAEYLLCGQAALEGEGPDAETDGALGARSGRGALAGTDGGSKTASDPGWSA